MKKVFKWIAYVLLTLIVLVLILTVNLEHKDGTYDGWSGLIALFQGHREFGYTKNIRSTYELNGVNGSYIIDDTVFSIDVQNQLQIDSLQSLDSITIFVANKDKDSFYLALRKDYKTYPMPKKLIAISDIEGNCNAFASFLQNNHVIDKNFNWTFGERHPVLVGDFMDRGKNVTQVLWLIYKLEQKAEKVKRVATLIDICKDKLYKTEQEVEDILKGLQDA